MVMRKHCGQRTPVFSLAMGLVTLAMSNVAEYSRDDLENSSSSGEPEWIFKGVTVL